LHVLANENKTSLKCSNFINQTIRLTIQLGAT